MIARSDCPRLLFSSLSTGSFRAIASAAPVRSACVLFRSEKNADAMDLALTDHQDSSTLVHPNHVRAARRLSKRKRLFSAAGTLNSEPANVNATPQTATFSQPIRISETTIARAPALPK